MTTSPSRPHDPVFQSAFANRQSAIVSAANSAVFLSYASQDADAARRIADALRAAGVEVWFDQSELVGGDAWDQKIRKQIRECALFIPILSKTTQGRREAYFRLEWKLADERTHLMAKGTPFLLPVTIDETNDREALVPDSFLAVQWTKLPGGETSSAFAERVSRLLAGATVTTTSESRSSSSTPTPIPTRRDENFWVAVLPFKYRGTDENLSALAEGLTEDIVAGLSRFDYLRVIASNSTARYAGQSVDVRTAAQELGARYVMEGSLRLAGSRLRIAVQIVDAHTGANLWAETFDRAFEPAAIFDLQDELVPRLVATTADLFGVLVQSIADILRQRGPGEFTANEAVLRSYGYYSRISPEEHAEVRDVLERAVEQYPDHGPCWAMLGFITTDEFSNGFNPRPDWLGRAMKVARRAVDCAPNAELVHHSLANTLFFAREFAAFRIAAERTIAINPFHATSNGYMGVLLAYAGDWERGCALARRGRELNFRHPGWLWFPEAFNAYRLRDYQAALDAGLKVNLPGYYWFHLVLAAAHAQLGQQALAAKALSDLLVIRPDFGTIARAEIDKWLNADPKLVEHFIDGLRKAGLEGAGRGRFVNEGNCRLPNADCRVNRIILNVDFTEKNARMPAKDALAATACKCLPIFIRQS